MKKMVKKISIVNEFKNFVIEHVIKAHQLF